MYTNKWKVNFILNSDMLSICRFSIVLNKIRYFTVSICLSFRLSKEQNRTCNKNFIGKSTLINIRYIYKFHFSFWNVEHLQYVIELSKSLSIQHQKHQEGEKWSISILVWKLNYSKLFPSAKFFISLRISWEHILCHLLTQHVTIT